MPELNLDPAGQLDITGIYEGTAFKIILRSFQDEACTIPLNLTGTFNGKIWRDSDEKPALNLSVGTNMTMVDNILTIELNDSGNTLKAGRYDLLIFNVIDADHRIPVYKGTIIVNIAT
jgi:hypothetical protein